MKRSCLPFAARVWWLQSSSVSTNQVQLNQQRWWWFREYMISSLNSVELFTTLWLTSHLLSALRRLAHDERQNEWVMDGKLAEPVENRRECVRERVCSNAGTCMCACLCGRKNIVDLMVEISPDSTQSLPLLGRTNHSHHSPCLWWIYSLYFSCLSSPSCVISCRRDVFDVKLRCHNP
jgi:hypothetical protein